MRETIERGKDTYSPHLLTLLTNRLDTCHIVLEELQATLAHLSPELVPTHERLISILRSMAAANTRHNVRLRPSELMNKSLTGNISFLQLKY